MPSMTGSRLVRAVALTFLLAGGAGLLLSSSNGSSDRRAHKHAKPRKHARTFHVSPRGSNGGPGTVRRPWRTLARSVRALRPGDVLIVHRGTYGRRGGTIRIRRSGSNRRRIVIRGPGRGPRPRILGHVRVDGSHVELRRLLFDGPTGPVLRRTGRNPRGEEVQLWIRGHDVRVARCEIRDNAWHAGVFLTGSDARLVRNWIHDNGDRRDPRQAKLDHGIYWGSGSGGVIADNLIESNLAYGIHLYPHPEDIRVVQNTLVRNGQAGLILASDTADVVVSNNIVAFNGSDRVTAGLSNTGNRMDTNLFWRNGNGDVDTGGSLPNQSSIVADPLFIADDDYRLSGESPALGRATAAYATSRDFTGAARGRPGDLGAFEGP